MYLFVLERVVMCCQYSDVILWNCIYLYCELCCDVEFICSVFICRELCLFETIVLWCFANTLMLYYGIVFICIGLRVVTCLFVQWCYTMYCIYLYGTCCDVLPIQWCYTMELYLFVWNVLWCVANTVMLYYGIVFICMVTCCDCVANTVMLYYGIVFICMERVVCDCVALYWCLLWNCIYLKQPCCDLYCQYSDVILWNCIYLYGTCCDVLPIQWCYTMVYCIYLYGTCCDVLPIQWCYTMELYLLCKKRVVMCCQYSEVILWNCIYL